MPAGRPSLDTAELRERICERLSDGETLIDICAADDMPSRQTVLNWQAKNPGFLAQCARARQHGAEACERRIAAIATNVENGLVAPEAARVALNALTWLAKVRDPRNYGDRQDVSVEHSGTLAIAPITFVMPQTFVRRRGEGLPDKEPPAQLTDKPAPETPQ